MTTLLPTVDFHTHFDRQQPLTVAGNVVRIVSVPLADADLPLPENCFATLEHHPWHGSSWNNEFAVTARDKRFIGIGEAGLDRMKGKLPLPEQIKEFTCAINLAEAVNKPLTIHCVKCFSELLELYKRIKWQVPTVIHYYCSNLALARQLWDHTPFLLSLPPKISDQPQLLDFLRGNPDYLRRIVLETDDPHHGDIESHYRFMAQKMDLEFSALQKIMLEQFERLYHAGNF